MGITDRCSPNLRSVRCQMVIWDRCSPIILYLVSVVFVCAYLLPSTHGAMEIKEEYCTSEKFNARCSIGDIILIRRALYGRLKAGRCITAEYGHALGCYSDVTTYLDDHCSGRHNCSMLVASIDSIAQPCAKDFKSYLEVTYECVKASFLDDCRDGNVTYLSEKQGYLALFARPIQVSGSEALFDPRSTVVCPWIIAVSSGQKINVTWQVSSATNPFRASSNSNGDGDVDDDAGQFSSTLVGSMSPWCPFTLTFLEEGNVEYAHQTCRSRIREPKVVYLSRSSRLEIQSRPSTVLSSSVAGLPSSVTASVEPGDVRLDPWKPYVLYYRVFGCSYSVLPVGATISKHGEDVAIICNDSLEVFYVTCVGNDWIGEIGNCTKAAFKVPGPSMVSQSESEFKHGVALAVLTGVVLGMIAGSLMLISIFVFRKSRRLHHQQQRRLQMSEIESGSVSGVTLYNRPRIISNNSCDYQAFHCNKQELPVCTECVYHHQCMDTLTWPTAVADIVGSCGPDDHYGQCITIAGHDDGRAKQQQQFDMPTWKIQNPRLGEPLMHSFRATIARSSATAFMREPPLNDVTDYHTVQQNLMAQHEAETILMTSSTTAPETTTTTTSTTTRTDYGDKILELGGTGLSGTTAGLGGTNKGLGGTSSGLGGTIAGLGGTAVKLGGTSSGLDVTRPTVEILSCR